MWECMGTPWENCYRKENKNINDFWDEFTYLLNVAYSQGLESTYMEEIS